MTINKSLFAYPACFYKEENGYSVIFPDLDYLATCGETLEEALSMVVDCLAGYLYWCNLEGESIPQPSPLVDISVQNVARELEFDFSEAFVNIITVDIAKMVDILPEDDQKFAQEFIKKLVLAWDPDFTKVTPQEAELIKDAEESGFVSESDIDWDHLDKYA